MTTGSHHHTRVATPISSHNQNQKILLARLHSNSFRPVGPALADDIFGVWNDEVACESDPSLEDDSYSKWQVTEKTGTTGDPFFDECWQPSLALETPEELRMQLQSNIRKYERGYYKMAMAALRWHQLMEDVKSNSGIAKSFSDLQMLRKLSGSDFE